MSKKLNIPAPPPPKKESKENKLTIYTDKDLYTIRRKVDMPHAIDLEEMVLGAMMIDKRGLKAVIDVLSEDIFFSNQNAIVFRAIKNIYKEEEKNVDLITVSYELKRIGSLIKAGGDMQLVRLTQKVASTAHVEYHARILIQKYVLRELIIQSSYVLEQSYYKDPDIFNLIDTLENSISTINHKIIKGSNVRHSLTAAEELVDKVKKVRSGESSGIYTFIDEFDSWSGGLQKRELIAFAAATGMGKTTAVMAIARKNGIERKVPTAFISLEMSEADLKMRLAAESTGIDYKKIRGGNLNDEELNQIVWYYDYIDKSELYIVEKITIHEKICSKVRSLVSESNIELAIIDYVQLVRLAKRTSNRTADLSIITNDLKALANELNITIIMLAQLDRSIDKRLNKRPMLSDLKHSGSIEEDSDMVLFLLREGYYREKEGMSLPDYELGKTKLIVAKGRSTGIRDFDCFLDFQQFDFRSI